jgi:hypothetical protein
VSRMLHERRMDYKRYDFDRGLSVLAVRVIRINKPTTGLTRRRKMAIATRKN